MKPYYEDGGVTIYHGDCREILPSLPKVDVMVTDPPYGMDFTSGHWPGDFRIRGDDGVAVRDEVLRMWGDEKPAAIFGTWRLPRPERTKNVLVWDKTAGTGPGMGDLSQAFGYSHEEIYLLGDWPKRGIRRGSVLSTSCGIRALAVRLGHPTPKPVGLIIMLLEAAIPGIVLDPFLGSGTTLRAAKDLGRKAIGIEIEERYCEIAVNRLGQEVFDFGGEET